MGPQEKHLTSELAVYLVRSGSRAMRHLPPGVALDPEMQRRWFQEAYREWQLTPRVELAGRSPYDVIAAERAAMHQARNDDVPATPKVELYTDLLLTPQEGVPAASAGTATEAVLAPDSVAPAEHTASEASLTGWHRLTQRLFGSATDRARGTP